jgi:ABC-type uncharacterized transport system permease subunit
MAVITGEAKAAGVRFGPRLAAGIEVVLVPVGAILVSLILFAAFLAVIGVDPFAAYGLMVQGAFGSWFSWQNTLTRASPLILTALCTALPARVGLVVIGAEGALVMGGLCGTAAALALGWAPSWLVLAGMALVAMLAGGLWIGAAVALRHWRGVNETISSLLMISIAIAILNQMVEGPLRDPESLNKPSTPAIGDANMLGTIFGSSIHWGLAFGIVACIVAYVVMHRTSFGFAARVIGGNVKVARMAGLPVGRIMLIVGAAGGAAAGLAGMVEVAAVHGRANASLAAGYGFTGILVSFLARHNPLAIMPVAVLLGGIGASGGLLQRRLDLPDATVLVLQGVIFIVILASEAAYGRIPWLRLQAKS